jgi:hypothetical protein
LRAKVRPPMLLAARAQHRAIAACRVALTIAAKLYAKQFASSKTFFATRSASLFGTLVVVAPISSVVCDPDGLRTSWLCSRSRTRRAARTRTRTR